MSSVTVELARKRLSAGERREQILLAASELFGSHGYVGTTTDQIARAAGISQPYVVRMFGTKENLYLEALNRACGALMATFRRVLAEHVEAGDLGRELGEAYIELIADRALLRIMMQSFLAGADPVIGPAARKGLLDIYRFLKEEARFEPDDIVRFIAHGMLINTLVGSELTSFDDPAADELVDCCLGAKADLVRRATAG